ncbi:Uncharacterised protein [Burkholderia pseudomallei]|nr:Uncharacterised protein [Burkholderia pseudomallei]VBU87014.1 Uncharacterised protein [Burkholderia pseudomallei]VCA32206.1 Uncharacterised protein [Burkholderia pseudomallei]
MPSRLRGEGADIADVDDIIRGPFDPAIACATVGRIVRRDRLIGADARRRQLLRRDALRHQISLDRIRARLAERDVRRAVARVVGVPDDLDRSVRHLRERARHLVENRAALRRERRAAGFEFDRAVRERLVEQALLGRAHAQPVLDRVGRIQRVRHVARELLALRLVVHFALHVDLRAVDLQLSFADLFQLRADQLLDVRGPVRRRRDVADFDLVDDVRGAVRVAQALQHGGLRRFVGNLAAGDDLARRRVRGRRRRHGRARAGRRGDRRGRHGRGERHRFHGHAACVDRRDGGGADVVGARGAAERERGEREREAAGAQQGQAGLRHLVTLRRMLRGTCRCTREATVAVDRDN